MNGWSRRSSRGAVSLSESQSLRLLLPHSFSPPVPRSSALMSTVSYALAVGRVLLLIDADSRSHVKSNSSSSTIQRTTMGSACSSSTSGRRMSRYVYPVHSLPDVGSKEKLRSAPQTLLNPFHTVTMPIRDPGFEAKVRQSAKRNL